MMRFDQILLENLEKQEDNLIRIYENRFLLFETNLSAILKDRGKCLCFDREVSANIMCFAVCFQCVII